MKRLFLVIILVLISVFTLAQSALAANPWEVGNERWSSYGAHSYITVPSSAPTLYSGLVAAWVGTPSINGHWAQCGWIIVYGYAPWSYTEYNVSGYHDLTYRSQLSYGDSSTYQVDWDFTYHGWNTYINGYFKEEYISSDLPTPPLPMLGYGEVQGSSSNQLYGYFYNALYENSGGNWYAFDQNRWVYDSPYTVTYTSGYPYNFTVSGP